ncbi:tRNA (adenosine(37)-N6)-threonylcarbamoyltransferase complex ATPase subunit type 1 TsaE [Helicobacter sp. 11S02596-1]|nr:tRNA (adenosine(37)-N6)-threonylcarbamoyltransferase complex ATPase subunit type 1 TsaE [Helicobacter sp. 11S02596-1]
MKEICANLDNISLVTTHLKAIAEGSGNKKSHNIFLLRGDLASGKTTLVRAYHELVRSSNDGANNTSEAVTSPTFSLMHQYGDIYHYDLYNKNLQDLLALGLIEWLENPGTHFVEWGDERLEALLDDLGCAVCVVTIEKYKDERIYRILNG